MKKLISILLIVLVLALSVALFACDDDAESTSQVESSSESTSESSSKAESSSSAKEESSSSSVESESEEIDPADVIDPNAPKNETITPFDAQGGYVIVCDKSDESALALATAFKTLISEKYSVTLEINDASENEAEHEIVIGNVRDNVKYIKNRLYSVNDFAISVCGDDLVLYATGERLYDYMLAIAEKLFDGSVAELDTEFFYHKSAYAKKTYAEYLRDKNGSVSYQLLQELFEARVYTAADNTKLPYRIYIPSSYDAEKSYPVVTILHGAGERGNDNAKQLLNMVPKLFSQEGSPFWDSIVICPQCPDGNQWVDTPWSDGNYSTQEVAESNELKAVIELIGETAKELSTDTDRYYAMGLSMGGYGTWDMIMRHTELFAGAVAMCGGADTAMASKLANFPVWALHGSSDTVVKPEGTQQMIYAMRSAAGGNASTWVFRYTPLGGYNHNIWDHVGDNGQISRWLFSHKLSDRAN